VSATDKAALDPLGVVLDRSDDLHETLVALLDDAGFDPSPRGQSSLGMCSVSLEHGLSLRILISAGCPTSAVSLMRLQFEALTRAMWLIYAANELEVVKLTAGLTVDSEQAAKNLPTVNAMIDDIGKRVGSTAPAAAHQMLAHFRDVQLKALNSFVHGGIHSLRRHTDGFPNPLVVQIVCSSNALSMMAAMTLAILSGDAVIRETMSRIQREFADCLPPLVAH
jgi:hypothetical protein